MARAVKEATVAELTERFQNSSGAVLTEYRGLTVAQVRQLRQALGEDATFAVVKNTLTKLAAKDAGVADDFSALLIGPSAIAFVGGDVVQAAKGLREFSRANPLLVIRGEEAGGGSGRRRGTGCGRQHVTSGRRRAGRSRCDRGRAGPGRGRRVAGKPRCPAAGLRAGRRA